MGGGGENSGYVHIKMSLVYSGRETLKYTAYIPAPTRRKESNQHDITDFLF